MNNLIFVPFAYINNANFGSNVKNRSKVIDIYMQNSFVALKSIQKYNPNNTVALVTNIDINKKYLDLFLKNNIQVLKYEFDSFRFPNDYHYCLAFYKLCAIKHVSLLNYDNFIMLDADIICKGSIENIFNEIQNEVMVYHRINSTLPIVDSLIKQNKQGYENSKRIKRMGGEFLACSKNNISDFILKAKIIYETMLKENIKNQFGDEFITSTAITLMENVNYGGGKYICRCETGWFRELPSVKILENISILHFPAEKDCGMQKLFKYLVKNNDFPDIKKIYKIMHIYKQSFHSYVKCKIKHILRKK